MEALLLMRGALSVGRLPDPVPAAGQLLARPLLCGICGSDLHVVDHGVDLLALHRDVAAAAPHSPLRGPAVDPDERVVLGHEFVAEVVGVGRHVAGFAEGDRVVSVPRLFDATGRKHTIGYSPGAPGALGELMLLDANLALRIPPDMDPAVAALTEPLAVARHAVAKAELDSSTPAVVVGCGPVGLAVILTLRSAGLGPVVGTDLLPSRRALAEQFGADAVVDPTEVSPTAVAMSLGSDPPLVFEAVGVPGVLDQVMLDAAPGTRIVVVGACLTPDVWRPMLALGRELTLSFALGYTDEEFAAAAASLVAAAIDPRPMITEIAPLEDAVDAFARLRTSTEAVKTLIGRP